MPGNNFNESKMNTTRKAKMRSQNEGKSHAGKSGTTKKVKRTLKNTPDRTKNHKGKSATWNRYQKLRTIYDFLHYLELEYPAICTVKIIGMSAGGLAIKMLKISNTDETNIPVWLDGTIHSREWISTSVVTFIANSIAKNFEQLPSYITNKDWYIVPVLNPDGYSNTQQVRSRRPSLTQRSKPIMGADFNRNFSYMWGINETSSSSDPHHSIGGAKSFPGPECAAVRNFISNSEKHFEIFLTFHSPDQAITIPWCHTAEPCPEYFKLMQGSAVMAKAIYQATGRIYKMGTLSDSVYRETGTSLDWSYVTAKIPFSYLIELRKGGKRFILPDTQILDTCKEATAAVESLLEFVDENKKMEPLSNQDNNLNQVPNTPCFSKHVHNNTNYSLTELFTNQNDDPMVVYCRNMPRMCKYKNPLLTKTLIRNLQWQNDWRVGFTNNCYTEEITNSLILSEKTPYVIKETHSVNTCTNTEEENWPAVDA